MFPAPKSSLRFRTRLPAALALLVGLGGCAALSAGPPTPPSIYDLSAPAGIGPVRGSGAQFVVAEPSAVRTIDSDRIVVRPPDGEVAYLAGAQWSDRLPRLLQARLIETLENTGKVKGVGRPGQGLAVDYVIAADIRAFEVDLKTNRAIAIMSVKLMNDRSGRVVAAQLFSGEAPVASDAPDQVIRGLNAATDQILANAARWVLSR